MYSPLHYSARARPASDGESDTVSAPAARRALARGLGPPAPPHLRRDRRGDGGRGRGGGAAAGPGPSREAAQVGVPPGPRRALTRAPTLPRPLCLPQ